MAAPREDPFPAPSKQASGTIDGIATEAAAVRFADKILLTISQDGRLSQWVRDVFPMPLYSAHRYADTQSVDPSAFVRPVGRDG